MPLTKTAFPINFSQGVDTKTDPFQITPGKFLTLQNTVFDTDGLAKKRNGFGSLPALPNSSCNYATTFSGNLTAIGTNLYALSSGTNTWVNKGALHPVSLTTLPLVRSNANQSQADSVVSPNGLVCTAYKEAIAGVTSYKYVIADSVTGQNLVAPTAILPSSGTVSGTPRVFLLGNFFVIVFTATITATAHLQYVAINWNSLAVTTAVDISTTYTPASTVAFDGVVANNSLYIGLNGSDGGGAIRVTYIDSTLTQHNTVVVSSNSGTIFSLCADTSGSTAVIYVSFYNSSTPVGKIVGYNQNLISTLSATTFTTTAGIVNLASVASSGVVKVLCEVTASYSFSSSIPNDSSNATNFVEYYSVTAAGAVTGPTVVARSIGLASKAFFVNSVPYFLAIYQSNFQPTYFLMNLSGNVLSRLAYENASSYYVTGLPNITVTGSSVSIAYFFKDLIQSANKSVVSTAAGIYSQTGVNLVTFNLGVTEVSTAEIGGNLNLTGGFLWMYDGFQAVEQNFFLWPDHVGLTGSGTGGTLEAGTYYYQVTYEWSDNMGNLFRSAPSIPVSVTTSGATSSVTINVPTLRLTYKTANPVKIVVYRSSVAVPVFYQINATSITTIVVNDTTTDSVAIVDAAKTSDISGNQILYTTGGVVEDVGAPSFNAIALYRSRLFGIDAEDPNLLWYSKQVIEATPVEMSDLFTLYVAPTQSAQGSTGPMRALSALDDKFIIFKRDSIYYITGNGPDNTGANNDFSDPVFVTSTVGCSNQNSIVFMPQGLMFQSDKGIWLLGRDLQTVYIGAPVQAYNSYTVLSAVNVPGTTQVRFTLSNGVTLMYDYFQQKWGTFTGIPGISSTLYQNQHTFINSLGQTFQETAGLYLDGTNPVLMKIQTGWFNMAGLQGFERIYYFYLLGTYLTPHKLAIDIAYDYSPSASQTTMISPDNFNPTWGSGGQTWGDISPWGGTPTLEQWRVFMQQQRCQAFQITITEIFDSFYSVASGAGLTLSGLNMVLGLKKQYKPIAAKNSVG